jgi:hypothetical protein
MRAIDFHLRSADSGATIPFCPYAWEKTSSRSSKVKGAELSSFEHGLCRRQPLSTKKESLTGKKDSVMASPTRKVPTSLTKSPAESARPKNTPELQTQSIAALAYQLWQGRGCPDGSPEEDWFRAEKEMQHGS